MEVIWSKPPSMSLVLAEWPLSLGILGLWNTTWRSTGAPERSVWPDVLHCVGWMPLWIRWNSWSTQNPVVPQGAHRGGPRMSARIHWSWSQDHLPALHAQTQMRWAKKTESLYISSVDKLKKSEPLRPSLKSLWRWKERPAQLAWRI